MGDISLHLSTREVACRCGCGYGSNPGDLAPELVRLFEAIREGHGEPIAITSGCRCSERNSAVGGVDGSEHTLGQALDLAVTGSAERLALVALAILSGCRRVGVAKTYVHIGVSRTHPVGLWGYESRC